MSNSHFITVTNLAHQYKNATRLALQDINLEIEKGELLALVGRSGSGKSTLLRVISGLEKPKTGKIWINGKVIYNEKTFIPPNKRNIGMVFQDYALFPHKTVLDNVKFGLSNKLTRNSRAKELIELVGLSQYLKKYPHELSGGEQQRVALARALAPQPTLLLLDEPFSNLDETLKDQVREDVRDILKKSETTAIFVTHDTVDALSVADRVAILNKGKLEQIDTPEFMYEHPVNEYVARFFGKANIMEVDEHTIETLHFENKAMLNHKILIRPEAIEMVGQTVNNATACRVVQKHFLGDKYEYVLKTDLPDPIIANTSHGKAAVGDVVAFRIKKDKLCIL